MSFLSIHCCLACLFFFFKQKTAYEMRISDWSSDVCSSDLFARDEGDADPLLRVQQDRIGPVRRQRAGTRAEHPEGVPVQVHGMRMRRAVEDLRHVAAARFEFRERRRHACVASLDRKSTRLNSSP